MPMSSSSSRYIPNGTTHKNIRGEGQSSSITTPNAIYNMTNIRTMTENILNPQNQHHVYTHKTSNIFRNLSKLAYLKFKKKKNNHNFILSQINVKHELKL